VCFLIVKNTAFSFFLAKPGLYKLKTIVFVERRRTATSVCAMLCLKDFPAIELQGFVVYIFNFYVYVL
jgi:hypothetical protein